MNNQTNALEVKKGRYVGTGIKAKPGWYCKNRACGSFGTKNFKRRNGRRYCKECGYSELIHNPQTLKF